MRSHPRKTYIFWFSGEKLSVEIQGALNTCLDNSSPKIQFFQLNTPDMSSWRIKQVKILFCGMHSYSNRQPVRVQLDTTAWKSHSWKHVSTVACIHTAIIHWLLWHSWMLLYVGLWISKASRHALDLSVECFIAGPLRVAFFVHRVYLDTKFETELFTWPLEGPSLFIFFLYYCTTSLIEETQSGDKSAQPWTRLGSLTRVK